jgi:DNA-binding transcriptional LysR family regulator
METFFREAGAEPAFSAIADTEAAIRGMVASGLGAGLVREDQALDAQRLGEAVVWKQWKATTWLCWVAAPTAKQSVAVRTVRETVMEVWG